MGKGDSQTGTGAVAGTPKGKVFKEGELTLELSTEMEPPIRKNLLSH